MEALYDRLSSQAFGLAYRILGEAPAAEDVVQEAFLTVWRQAERIDAARGRLTSFVLTVVHHKAIDVLRTRRGLLARQLPIEPAEVRKEGPDVEDRVIQAMAGAEVRKALESLPDEQRIPVQMAYFEGLTHVEIAEALSLPLGTVKSRLRLALEKLRIVMKVGETR